MQGNEILFQSFKPFKSFETFRPGAERKAKPAEQKNLSASLRRLRALLWRGK
jgi:hypothetical protein